MTININLLPWREEQKEQQKREFVSMAGLGVVIASGLMLCIHMMIGRQISFQLENNDYLKAQIKQLDLQIAEIEALQKEKAQLLARMEIIQQLQTNRPHVVRLFDGIVHTVPEGLYLTNLTRMGSHIVMDGKAESNTRVSTFMRNIERSSWLKDPVLTVIQADEPKEGAKATERQVDKMIGFNLQAEQVMNDLNAHLSKEDSVKATDGQSKAVPASGAPSAIPNPTAQPSPKPK